MVKKYDKNIITYKNNENLKQIPTTEKKISFKKLLKTTTAGISGIATFLASNNALVLLGNIGQDEVIRYLQNLQTIYTHGSIKEQIQPNEFLASIFKFAGNVVSVSWATLMAYPEIFSAVVAFFATIGAVLVFKVADKIKINKENNYRKVKTKNKVFTK